MSMPGRVPACAVVAVVLLACAQAARGDLIVVYFTGTVTRAFTDVDFPGATVLPIAAGDPVLGRLRYDPAAPAVFGSLSLRAGGLAHDNLPVLAAAGPGGGRVDYAGPWTNGWLDLGSGAGGTFDFGHYTGAVLYVLDAGVRRVDYDPLTAPEPPAWGLAVVGAGLLAGWAAQGRRRGQPWPPTSSRSVPAAVLIRSRPPEAGAGAV